MFTPALRSLRIFYTCLVSQLQSQTEPSKYYLLQLIYDVYPFSNTFEFCLYEASWSIPFTGDIKRPRKVAGHLLLTH